MNGQNIQRIEDDARRFLAAAAAGARGRELSGLLVPLLPHLDRVIAGVHARWNGRAPYQAEDLRQDTYERMLGRPPRGTEESHRAIATIGAWTRNTAFNILKDKYEQARRRRELAPPETGIDAAGIESRDLRLARDSTEKLRPDRQAEMSTRVASLSRFLEAEDPAVARYFHLWIVHRGPTAREMALIIGTTHGYAEQLQYRLRVLVACFNDGGPAEVA